MPKSPFPVPILIATACISLLTINVQASVTDITTTANKTQAWNGFAPDFDPEWEGESVVIDSWQEPKEDTGSGTWISSGTIISGTTCGSDVTILAGNWQSGIISGHWETRSTVRKVSASSNSEVTNSTWLQLNGQEFTADNNNSYSWVSQKAHYAELLAPNGKLLANASSIAYNNADFGEDDFSASGRVSSVAILSTDPEEAKARATGQSWLDATYELDEDTAFSMELDIARLGDAIISFRAINTTTNEKAFSLPLLEPTGSQTINIDGILEAGTYQFLFNCKTNAAIDSFGGWNLGGQAEFDFSLDLEEAYRQVWVPGNGSTDGTWEMGDFNSDSEVIGSDVTILAGNWQCLAAQTMQVSPVPEPSTLLMLLFGGFTGLLVTWRRRN